MCMLSKLKGIPKIDAIFRWPIIEWVYCRICFYVYITKNTCKIMLKKIMYKIGSQLENLIDLFYKSKYLQSSNIQF